MKYLYEHIKDFVCEKNIYLTDSERVDEVKDYERFLNDFIAIVDEEITDFIGFEGETRLLKFKIKSIKFSIFVKGNTDYIDEKPIVSEFNKNLKNIGKNGKIYSFWSGDFGQEIGFFYIEDFNVLDKLSLLLKENYDIGQIDGLGEVEKNQESESLEIDVKKIVNERIKENQKVFYTKSDNIILLISFLLVLFGAFFELIVPVNLNIFTGIISGLIIGIGIYQINKRI